MYVWITSSIFSPRYQIGKFVFFSNLLKSFLQILYTYKRSYEPIDKERLKPKNARKFGAPRSSLTNIGTLSRNTTHRMSYGPVSSELLQRYYLRGHDLKGKVGPFPCRMWPQLIMTTQRSRHTTRILSSLTHRLRHKDWLDHFRTTIIISSQAASVSFQCAVPKRNSLQHKLLTYQHQTTSYFQEV